MSDRVTSSRARVGSMPWRGPASPRRWRRPSETRSSSASSATGRARRTRSRQARRVCVGRCAHRRAEARAQRLGDRPPHVGLAVGDAAPLEDGGAVVAGGPLGGLLDQAGLAHAGLGDHDDGRGAVAADGGLDDADEEADLVRRGRRAARRRGGCAGRAGRRPPRRPRRRRAPRDRGRRGRRAGGSARRCAVLA